MTYDDLTVLIPGHSLEDFPTELGDRPAEGLLNGWAVLWHPLLLATAGDIPKWHRADDPPTPRPGRLIIVPTACDSLVTTEWIDRGRKEGMHIVKGITERQALLQAVLEPLQSEYAVDAELAADFVAFGHLHLQTELLTRQMRQFGNLDAERLRTDAVAAAKAAVVGDGNAARTHLRHCFEQLQEAREKFYPVHCYLIDLCLLTPRLAGEPLERLLQHPTPVNLLATAQDLQTIVSQQPAVQGVIRDRWAAGTLEVVGGEWAERCSTLLPLDAEVQELGRGRQALQELFGRRPATWGRRRYGLSPLLPQLLKRHGYTGALHFVMDDGIYPDEEYAKLQWQGADASAVPSYSRIPLAGDSASAFLRFPVRMSESMDHDYVAGLVFARWPEMRSPWLEDFRRAQRYAPALGEFITFEKFFSETDLDGRMSEFRRGNYLSPFLVQAVARREAAPVSRYVEFLHRRRRFEALDWCAATAQMLATGRVAGPTSDPASGDALAPGREVDGPGADASRLADVGAMNLEIAVADSGPDIPPAAVLDIDARLLAAERESVDALAQTLLTHAGSQRGVLVLNSLSFPRKVVIDWPGEYPIPEATAPVVSRQCTPDCRQVVVDAPPCGYTWIPAPSTDAPLPAAPKTPLAEELVVRNEFLEVTLSNVTGGIAQVRTYGRGGNRLSQQLAWRFSREKTLPVADGQTEPRKTWYSDMVLREQRVLSEGPALGAVETVGDLIDPSSGKLLATYRQTVRVWRGRPFAEVEIELGVERNPEGDPWTNYIAARFAWNDSEQALTRSQQETAAPIKDEQRMESPHYIELSSEQHRTTILTGGLSFHRLTGPRMLDTLLVTEGERQRTFRFAIAVDQSFPMEAALDWETPAHALPIEHGPPRSAPAGWLFQVGARNVQLRRVLPLRGPAAEQGRAGCIVRLQETEGRNKTFRLGCCRPPSKAQQVDFDGKPLHTFKLEDGAALVSIAPCELCDVELRFD